MIIDVARSRTKSRTKNKNFIMQIDNKLSVPFLIGMTVM